MAFADLGNRRPSANAQVGDCPIGQVGSLGTSKKIYFFGRPPPRVLSLLFCFEERVMPVTV